MSVTFTANYKEIFAAKTVEFIDNLLEDNYCLDDILEFIDNHNEADFVAYYEEYVTQGENLGYDVVDAFIEYHGDVSYVESVEDAYRGHYDSEADFTEEFYSDKEIPVDLVIDWQATWDSNLRYDFDFVNGYVFSSNF